MPQNRLPKCLKPKKTTLSLKKQFCFKKAYKFIWKRPQNRLPKCRKPKKPTLSLKKQFCSKKLVNSYEKRPQNRLPKCLKPKKQTLSLKKQFCSKKAYKFIWKKAAEPFSKMPEAKKTHFHWKKICSKKTDKFIWKKGHRTVFQNPWSQKNKHSHWKNNSVSKNLINSYEKRPQNRFPKCLKPKKTTLSLKNRILQIHMKKGHRTVFQNAWSQKSKHSHWKNNSVSKKAYKFIW